MTLKANDHASDAIRRRAHQARERKAVERASQYPSKRHAYQRGYKVGYNRAFRAWKARYDHLLAQLQRVGRRDVA